MDAKKNTAKEILPQITEENPSVEAEIEYEFDEIEMEPMPMMENQATPNMNTPCWHCTMMSAQQTEVEIPMEGEVPVPLIPLYEIEDDIEVGNPMTMRGLEDFTDFGYTNYNYRDYDDVDDILEKILIYNPGIFRRLASFGVPFPAAIDIVRRIIKITLNYR